MKHSRHHRAIGIALLVLVASIALPPAAPAERIVGRASVVDGDTIEMRGVRIRLHGIDAPESSQLCYRQDGTGLRRGAAAAFALADRIGASNIECRSRDTDRYGRMIAVCYQDGEDLDAWMVLTGNAVAYRRYACDYFPHENAALSQSIEIWSMRFDMPSDWRRAN